MTIAVDLGRKATKQTKTNIQTKEVCTEKNNQSESIFEHENHGRVRGTNDITTKMNFIGSENHTRLA